MPALENPKHELFAQNLAKGMTQIEAYEKAGFIPKAPNAARLITNDKIQSRISELQEKAAEKAAVTIESIAAELDEARALALQEKQTAAAVSASMGKAKLFGLIVDKAENKNENRNVEVLDRPVSEDQWQERHAPPSLQ